MSMFLPLPSTRIPLGGSGTLPLAVIAPSPKANEANNGYFIRLQLEGLEHPWPPCEPDRERSKPRAPVSSQMHMFTFASMSSVSPVFHTVESVSLAFDSKH